MEEGLTDQLLAMDGVDSTSVINEEEPKAIDVFFKGEAIPLELANEVARLLSCYGYISTAVGYDPTINKVILSAHEKCGVRVTAKYKHPWCGREFEYDSRYPKYPDDFCMDCEVEYCNGNLRNAND